MNIAFISIQVFEMGEAIVMIRIRNKRFLIFCQYDKK